MVLLMYNIRVFIVQILYVGSSLGIGGIAGIVAGCVVLILIIVIIAVVKLFRTPKEGMEENAPQKSKEEPVEKESHHDSTL